MCCKPLNFCGIVKVFEERFSELAISVASTAPAPIFAFVIASLAIFAVETASVARFDVPTTSTGKLVVVIAFVKNKT